MALEPGPCLGLSSNPILGVRTAQVFTVSLSWVRPKANGGRPGHVSHPLELPPVSFPQGRCAPWAEAQGLQSPIFRAALMSELKLRSPSFLPFQRVHQVQRTVPQGRCAPWAEAQGLQPLFLRPILRHG